MRPSRSSGVCRATGRARRLRRRRTERRRGIPAVHRRIAVRQSSTGTPATRCSGPRPMSWCLRITTAMAGSIYQVFDISPTPVWLGMSLATGIQIVGDYYGLPGDIPVPHAAIRNATAMMPPRRRSRPWRPWFAAVISIPTAAAISPCIGRPPARGSRGGRSTVHHQHRDDVRHRRDTPVPGDYDGDGRLTAPSTRRRAVSGQSRSTFGGVYAVQWGLDGDVPVPADYDGDGRTDLAVFRPVNGVWYIVQSSSNNTTWSSAQWGLNGDVPAPADYDGDGLTDLAVFRPATGVWHILRSIPASRLSWRSAGACPATSGYRVTTTVTRGPISPSSVRSTACGTS